MSHDDEMQGEPNSISNQKALLGTFAEKNGFMGIRHFTDSGISRTTFDCPRLQALIAEVKQGNIDTAIVNDNSRIGRNYILTGHFRELMRQINVRLIAMNEGTDIGSDMEDNFLPLLDVIDDYNFRDGFCGRRNKYCNIGGSRNIAPSFCEKSAICGIKRYFISLRMATRPCLIG